jgi:ComF family protein
LHRSPATAAKGATRTLYEAGRRIARATLDFVYPPQCACCGGDIEVKGAVSLCLHCRADLAPEAVSQCPRCAAFANVLNPQTGPCIRCRDEHFRFDRVFALSRYERTSRDVVLRMKHSHEEPLMMAMGRLLAERFGGEIQSIKPDVVLPIPMHWTRRLVRGTNSPELMGHIVSKSLHIDFGPRSLRRKRRTRKLAELSRQERKHTLRDAFAVGRGCNFTGAHVLLVDDVLTTGTTCHTAARVLKKSGAREVSVLVIARAYPGD